ncbi:hypothetical protein Poly21_29920 [Allorhodopirellula heiligendammensis]|uniref:Uncharacterized protein n=1 Tax=Allorhodopirellula heiligendammensis TaxID=2714739 RepID=A0A5C6BU69_9BACT|nr:hypothetical protein Poly21_29920 [Allorhodopirellula heiligendammensis]
MITDGHPLANATAGDPARGKNLLPSSSLKALYWQAGLVTYVSRTPARDSDNTPHARGRSVFTHPIRELDDIDVSRDVERQKHVRSPWL